MDLVWTLLCRVAPWLAAVLFVAWFFWITRGTDDADPDTLSYRLYRAWRRLAFWAGDVRLAWQWYFGVIPLPLLSWVKTEHEVSYEEFLGACERVEPGDILLATKFGYIFSNSAIPGCFKHAAIVTQTGTTSAVIGMGDEGTSKYGEVFVRDLRKVRIVEAVSEGVLERHPLHALADLMIILRPIDQEPEERQRAAATARKLVGCEYDVSFDFNIEEELTWLAGRKGLGFDMRERDELVRVRKNFRSEFDVAFSCTEVVATAWWFRHAFLGLSRRKVRGRLCITADQFVTRRFKVVWTNVETARASRRGLQAEGLEVLEEYWSRHKGGRTPTL